MNRDYKTTHDRATRNLRAHKILMDRFLANGIAAAPASVLALKELNKLSTAEIKRLVEVQS